MFELSQIRLYVNNDKVLGVEMMCGYCKKGLGTVRNLHDVTVQLERHQCAAFDRPIALRGPVD